MVMRRERRGLCSLLSSPLYAFISHPIIVYIHISLLSTCSSFIHISLLISIPIITQFIQSI